MRQYTVAYRDPHMRDTDPPLLFFCLADDPVHAREQWVNAYPQARLVYIAGFRDDFTIAVETPAAPAAAPVKLWIAIHGHKHGEDLFPFFRSESDSPSLAEVIRTIIDSGSSYEPEREEWIDIRGPWDLPDKA